MCTVKLYDMIMNLSEDVDLINEIWTELRYWKRKLNSSSYEND